MALRTVVDDDLADLDQQVTAIDRGDRRRVLGLALEQRLGLVVGALDVAVPQSHVARGIAEEEGAVAPGHVVPLQVVQGGTEIPDRLIDGWGIAGQLEVVLALTLELDGPNATTDTHDGQCHNGQRQKKRPSHYCLL